MTDYATLAEMKAYLGIEALDTLDDTQISAALTTVSRGIENVCGRVFTTDVAATARTFEVRNPGMLITDDFYTTTGLLVSGTAYSAATWTLRPLNGVVSGQSGWPYNRITPAASWTSLCVGTTVEVTAKWGWATVPAPIHQACLIAASDMLGLKDARFGVAGYGEFGPMRVRDNAAVMSILAPYVRWSALVA